MEEIRQQVSRARRRLILQQFIDIFTWTLFAALVVAVIGVAIPKIWPLGVDVYMWTASWIGGSMAGAVLLAAILTYVVRRNILDAAFEIDRRYGLKERVSSTLSLAPLESGSDIGQALIEDASRRVARIDVRERFRLSASWRTALPLVPAVFVFALMMVQNAEQRAGTATASENEIAAQEQVRKANEELKKRIQEKRKQMDSKDVKDADLEMLLKKLEAGVEKINSSNDLDRKKAMVQLNDLKKQLEERRKQLDGADNAKKQLNQLKDLKSGPADKIAKAIRDGNFKNALEQIKQLADRLENDELSDEEKQQLAEQLNEMKDKMQQMVDAHEQAKRDLEERIKQAEQQGNAAEAAKMRDQLDRLQQQDQQMQRLQEMAAKLGECSKCLNQGDGQGAADQLAEMMNDLQEMQGELDQLQTLDELMDQIADAKNAMNCDNCAGNGCAACMGQGTGMFGQMPGEGDGLGEGQGFGHRPEEETETSAYDSQVRVTPKPGEAVVTGVADGPNRKGISREEIKQEMESSLREESDPLSNQPLPRTHREHAKEYFERLRRGE